MTLCRISGFHHSPPVLPSEFSSFRGQTSRAGSLCNTDAAPALELSNKLRLPYRQSANGQKLCPELHRARGIERRRHLAGITRGRESAIWAGLDVI